MQIDIDKLFGLGFFSNLDYFFATNLAEISKENSEIIKLSAALVSKNSREGHLCIDILKMSNRAITIDNDSMNPDKFKLPEKKLWLNALKSSKIVGKTCDYPLVLDSDCRLYLARFFDYQQRFVKNISQRVKYKSPGVDPGVLGIEINKHFDHFKKEFDQEKKAAIETQKDCVQKALKNNFLIIPGGPGTGKTYIADKIGAVFSNLSKQQTSLKIVYTAPTGKAASKFKSGLTIHRLLQIKTSVKTRKQYTEKKISADLVIIDEASMIDIALMTKLLEAIPLSTKVIIFGDKNQLGSIETGSLFADICESEKLNNFIVNLDYNFRSGRKHGINKLARAINSGNVKEIETIFSSFNLKNYNDLAFININDSSKIESDLKNIIIKGYTPYFQENNLELAHKKLGEFKILCCLRKSSSGSDNLNKITENLLQTSQIHGIKQSFLKSILMITKNDYNKLLFNGDMGMLVKTKGEIKAFFQDKDSSLRSFNISQLKTFEHAFAITVHKSQGSEFDHVLLVLPSVSSPVLTRELLYTAITRARKKVTIAGSIDVIKHAAITHSKKLSNITKLLDKSITYHKDNYHKDKNE